MLKEQQSLVKWVTMTLDALVVVVAFFAAYFLRVHFHTFYKLDLFPSEHIIGGMANFQIYLLALFLWVPLWVLMLSLNGLYRPFRTRFFLEMAWGIIRAAFFTTIAFASIAFILKMQFVSRFFFIILVGLTSLLLISEKWVTFSVMHYFRMKGYNFRRLLLVGSEGRMEKFIKTIEAHPEWGLRISGVVNDKLDSVGKELFGIKVMGVLKDIPRILRENVIDEVIFIVPLMWLPRIQACITYCETQGVKASLAADLFNLRIARARQTDLNGFPLISFETIFGREWQLLVKRLVDLTFSTLGIIIFSPFFVMISTAIKLTSPGPVFFKQKRMGMNGRIFTLFKFRTMYKDAEEKLVELKHLNEMDGPVFKIKNDPRMTPVGKFLRTTSIDELPQLFNILRGHMSLVGPRPPIPGEVNQYENWQKRRLSMRPGLTCFWQINGRNKLNFKKWIEMDLKYIDNWSLRLDFKILMKTIPVVLFGAGAS